MIPLVEAKPPATPQDMPPAVLQAKPQVKLHAKLPTTPQDVPRTQLPAKPRVYYNLGSWNWALPEPV